MEHLLESLEELAAYDMQRATISGDDDGIIVAQYPHRGKPIVSRFADVPNAIIAWIHSEQARTGDAAVADLTAAETEMLEAEADAHAALGNL